MKDFHYHAPAEIGFGIRSEAQAAEPVKKYGGRRYCCIAAESAERSGLLGELRRMLEKSGIRFAEPDGIAPPVVEGAGGHRAVQKGMGGIRFVEPGGIAPPVVEGAGGHRTVQKGTGGGSVIDSAKAIAYGAAYVGGIRDPRRESRNREGASRRRGPHPFGGRQ